MENKDVINHISDALLAAVLFTSLTACLTEILPATPEWNKHQSVAAAESSVPKSLVLWCEGELKINIITNQNNEKSSILRHVKSEVCNVHSHVSLLPYCSVFHSYIFCCGLYLNLRKHQWHSQSCRRILRPSRAADFKQQQSGQQNECFYLKKKLILCAE